MEEFQRENGAKNMMDFYNTCCEMIGCLSKVVFSSSPLKLTSINGQINGKCIFTDQNRLSIIEGSYQESSPFGKTKIITKDKIILLKSNSPSESTYQVSLIDFEKKLKLFGSIPKEGCSSESVSKMTVAEIEKDGIIWKLSVPVKYNRDIIQSQAEARFSNGYLKAVLINGNILFGRSNGVVLAVDGKEMVVQYLSRNNNVITATGDVWRLDSDINRIEKNFVYLKN